MSLSPTKHWIVLRVTAIAAIPLCVWFIYSVLSLQGADYATFTGWLKQPVNAVLMIAFIVINFYHAMLGVHEILEDYVHHKTLLKLSMALKALFFVAVGAACVYSITKIAFLGG